MQEENLLGYALGALDGPERDNIEQQLEIDPELRRKLDEVLAILVPLEPERGRSIQAPVGLAERTCALVSEYRSHRGSVTLKPASVSCGFQRTLWTSADAIVAAGIFLAAAMLFFPAIASSRQEARQLACADNLRQLGLALTQYSQRNNGYFPHIPASGNRAVAGFYAPLLMESGELTDSRCLICPSSVTPASTADFRVPSVCEIDRAAGEELVLYWRMMGGNYGYNLGVMADKGVKPIRNQSRSTFAIMADAPRMRHAQGIWGSHRGHALNVLYEDLHVRLLVHGFKNACYDDCFYNDLGQIQAGVHQGDSVIGNSSTPPLLQHGISLER